MSKDVSRRQMLKHLGRAGAGAFLALPAPGNQSGDKQELVVAGQRVELVVTGVTPQTIRISLLPIQADGQVPAIPYDGSLVAAAGAGPPPRARVRSLRAPQTVRCGGLAVRISPNPLTVRVEGSGGRLVQQLGFNPQTAAMSFLTGDGPLFGLGEGGPQFDRRGSHDQMRNGQGGYRLRTFGGRVPVPWLIGTSGWAMFVHQPFGTFNLTGPDARFEPGPSGTALPLDVFIIGAREPAQIMTEYARLTGQPEMPPLWALGYQQSHRTLASREEVLSVAKTFREKKLPCDALIYLGTGFCPSGWNTGHGSFAWNPSVFPDPKEVIRQLQEDNFKVVLHVVIRSKSIRGTVLDRCDPATADEQEAGCYWPKHRETFSLGVDGWWPDEGDPLNAASRLARIRMYWEGPQIDRPNLRPYALHRNGYAGMQRYGAFLWSGDVHSTWETLRTHIPVAINTALTGIPFWGTDTGGFIPTKDLTGELYARWFQFSAFCPLFRSHGRTWKLRLPWGWNTGELGPNEITVSGDVRNPEPSELHNPDVEPICRKYLELRYRLMPYLYTAVREAHDTGMPIMRALWLHYPDDARAVERGDEYLWGRDILVAPVVEQGAASRSLYLPRGLWYDFWTREKIEGGREISRPVDLATMPLYIRAGAVLPMGPVKQHTGEKADAPLTVWVYPGADGSFSLYEDDGKTFDYRKGEWMRVRAAWDDRHRVLAIRLAPRSRMLPPLKRKIEVRMASEDIARTVIFDGRGKMVTM